MILVTSRDALAAAMSRVGGIINKANTIPILSHVLLQAENGTLMIRATNLDMEATDAIPCEIGEPGTVTVAADKLADIARNLPAESVIAFKLNGDRLAVTSGRSRFSLATLDPKTFPQLWADEWPYTFSIDAGKLAELLNYVAYAQSDEASRAWLCGVRFETNDGRLRLIAAGYSGCAYRDGPEIADFPAVTVPTRMVTEMRRLLTGADGDATIGLSGRKFMLQIGEAAVTSKLIDTSTPFPPYRNVIPESLPRSAEIHISDLSTAIRRAQLAAQYAGGQTVRLTFRTGTLAVTSQNQEAEVADEIDADYEGDETTVSLNPNNILELLASLSGDRAQVDFEGRNKAMIWRAVGDEDGIAVVMPQRIG